MGFVPRLADGLEIDPYAGGFAYGFQAEEEFLVLEYITDTETARCTLFSEDGVFSGKIDLLHTYGVSRPEGDCRIRLAAGSFYRRGRRPWTSHRLRPRRICLSKARAESFMT